MSPTRPWWIPLAAVVIAAGYLPTARTPFDFIDDGNLVYPAPAGTTAVGHIDLWWAKVQANYDHLGPVRPTLWAHWEVMANVAGGDPLAWRLIRLAFCSLSAGMLLWLFRELRMHPVAAMVTAAAAMWNPYRNEIWTSLTLAEGVAMPYALLALVAPRKAEASSRPWAWDAAAVFGLVAALGCKNTFVALIPAMMILRANGRRALVYALPATLVAAHFVYFKRHWHPGQYETHGPSVAQLGRLLNALKGAMNADFLGVGVASVAIIVAYRSPRAAVRGFVQTHRTPLLAAVALTAAGVAVYLPMDMMSGRYAMPAVWGLDILLGFLLTAFLAVPRTRWKCLGWAAVWVGLAAVAVANAGRQEKFAARARMLWDAVEYVERTAPPDATVAWVCGDSLRGGLNVEEGIHFRWHLFHRGRTDVQVLLIDADGNPVPRVELPVPTAPPTLRLDGTSGGAAGWEDRTVFAADYWLGRKKYECHLATRTDPRTAAR